MRIGLNLLYLIPGVNGGTETYAKGLLNGISEVQTNDEFYVYLSEAAKEWELPKDSRFKRVVCAVSGHGRARRYYFEQVLLPALLKRDGVEFLHSLGYVAPIYLKIPSAATIHDMNFTQFGGKMNFYKRWALKYFVTNTAKTATRVIAVSEFSKKEIVEKVGINPEKVCVVYEAPLKNEIKTVFEPSMMALRAELGEKYIVAFSSSSPNKNIPSLIDAFNGMKKRDGIRLVLIGHRPGHYRAATENGVVWTGYLDRAEMESIVKGAMFLVFPSFYEGFGLPVLEAMSLGTPVVLSRAASLPEVGGTAAEYFNPYSVGDIMEKMDRMVSDPDMQSSLREKGFKNLERFSWKKAAEETLAVYREAFKSYYE